MQQLPKGYYAVQSDLANASQTTFTYRGVTYAVTLGVNLFPNATEANAVAAEIPDVVLEGLPYERFTAPVLLFSAGEHRIGKRSIERVQFSGSRILLGEGVGINPNLPGDDPMQPPALNPARGGAGESVLAGGYDYGTMAMVAHAPADLILFDGFTWDRARFADNRSGSGDHLGHYVFRNIIHTSPCGHNMYTFGEIDTNTAMEREVLIENVRITNLSDMGYGGIFAWMNAQKTTMKGICIDGTSQVLGLTNITKSFANNPGNCAVCEYTISDSYFRNIGGENGLATACRGDGAVCLTVENCTFIDASRPGESFLQPHLANDRCKLTVKGCRFADTRQNDVAIGIWGDGENMEIADCTFSGFAENWRKMPAPPTEAPDFIEARPNDWQTDTADAHTVIGTDTADFTELTALYAGRRAYYGDQHAHSDCGGKSDGSAPIGDYPSKMDQLSLDFVALVDHQQMRGFFLPEWDDERFIIGTEPGTHIIDTNAAAVAMMHYNMLFPHKYGLAMVLANFPEFEFRGDELTGSFKYPKFTKERFMELTAYVQSIGGIMVHPHPKVLMGSDDPLDYYVGENMHLEVMVASYERHGSFRSYELWCDLLALDKHVYAAGGSDTHGAVTNRCVSTFYSKEKSGRAFFDVMHSGDYTAGAFGIQMCIDGQPMGSTVAYKEGSTLSLRVGDPFAPAFKGNTVYELRVITDQGLAYASRFNGKEAQTLTLAVQDRKFYRAEVMDVTHGYRIAVGNPIWLA